AIQSVTIIYDTMWQSTEAMTQSIVKGVIDEGLDCKVVKLRATPQSVAAKEFWKSRGTLIGSPTLNNLSFPTIGQFLANLRGLRPKNRLVGAFGSFGWGGGAVKEIYDEAKKLGLAVFEPGLQVLYRPSLEDEARCYEFGKVFASKVREYHATF
ncbi:MAG TPA: flavodoxin domain-containing protein, partial [Syntrophorhabdales bacterium]|nr:flavodoxin domain-containing protein [Syntrophorhabdales bacterium]